MPKVVWYFRKKRTLGNFSIENSFRELLPHFEESEWQIEWREASWFSEGIWNRLRIALEAKRLDADIIHITGDINFAALLLKGRKAVLTIHDNGFLEEHRGWKRWLMKKVWLDWPLKRCDRVVAVSNATKRSILEHTDYPEDRIEVIHSVVPAHFKPRTVLPNNPKPVLLHIGLAPNKNLKGHVEAIQGMDVLLRIIGEPSAADHAMLKSFSIDYEWKSKLSDEEMQEAYATSDVLLFCSTLEGFGMPILEAKAVGLPVITSDLEPMNVVGLGWAKVVPKNGLHMIKSKIEEILSETSKTQSWNDDTRPQAMAHDRCYRRIAN